MFEIKVARGHKSDKDLSPLPDTLGSPGSFVSAGTQGRTLWKALHLSERVGCFKSSLVHQPSSSRGGV